MLRTGLVACLVLLLAAGCGGGGAPRAHTSARPKLPRALAQQWASEADQIAASVAANDGCGAQQLAQTLDRQVTANSDRIPVRLQAPLLASVAALSGRISCIQVIQPKPKPPKHGPKPKKKHDHGPPHGPGGDGGGGPGDGG